MSLETICTDDVAFDVTKTTCPFHLDKACSHRCAAYFYETSDRDPHDRRRSYCVLIASIASIGKQFQRLTDMGDVVVRLFKHTKADQQRANQHPVPSPRGGKL